jgi:hypothetical protein
MMSMMMMMMMIEIMGHEYKRGTVWGTTSRSGGRGKRRILRGEKDGSTLHIYVVNIEQ